MTNRMRAPLSVADLPLPELMCASLDGELYPLGACWCPIDELDTAHARAASLAPLVPRRAIVERHSAAWVYGLVAEPRQHELCVDLRARAHTCPSPRVHVREVVGADGDTHLMGGVRVTTPLRTVLDLARWTPPQQDENLLTLLRDLLRYGGFTDTEPARFRCEERSIPNRAVALRRLAEAEKLLRFD